MQKESRHSKEAKEREGEAEKRRIPWNKGKKGLQIAWNKGIPMKSKSRLKLSESLKKAMSNPEVRKRMSEISKKALSNPEIRKKMSDAHKGQVVWNKGKKYKNPKLKGRYHSEESKKMMSLTRKRLFSEGKLVHPMKGKKHSKESLLKMKESHKGQVVWNKGITPREETKRKISESTKIAMSNPEIRKKISEANKGRIPWHKGKTGVYSKEVLRKWSDTHKKTMSNPEVRKRIGRTLREKYSSNPEILMKMAKTQKERMSNPMERERVRQQILKMYESGKFPKQTNTKPERQIKEELIKRGYKEGINFVHQYKFMDKFMCDFCFPKEKVIVETYGDFWHSNPNKYADKTKLRPHQIKNMGRDKSKEAYISKVNNHSWTYLTLWEGDIKKDIIKCVDKIEEVLKSKRQI